MPSPEPHDVVISIKPNFAQAIYAGQKTIEFRRRFPDSMSSRKAWIYETAPVSQITGFVTIAFVETVAVEGALDAALKCGGLTSDKFWAYFAGSETATGALTSTIAPSPEKFISVASWALTTLSSVS